MEIIYPSVDDVIDANKRAIELLKVTKAEKHRLIVSKDRIQKTLDDLIDYTGDVNKKAAFLLKEINRKHFFESANKRTSFLITSDFLIANGGSSPLKKIDDVKFLIEIREGRKSIEEIERWLSGKKV